MMSSDMAPLNDESALIIRKCSTMPAGRPCLPWSSFLILIAALQKMGPT